MSYGNHPYPQEWNVIPISNIPNREGKFLSFFYDSTEKEADVAFINYESKNELNRKGVEYDVAVKEINKCIVKIFTNFDEI